MKNKLTEALIEKLNKFDTTPFLFVGTGLSLRYINAETWEGLLRKFAELSKDNKEFSYEIYLENAKQQSKGLLKSGSLFSKIAGLIEKDFNLKWLQDKRFLKNRESFGNIAKQGVSPFKIEIADHFNKKKINYSDENLSEINILRRVGERSVSGVITTNYDTLLEDIFPNFKTYVGQDELLFSSTQSIAEIYKIHGCCNNPKTIIITDHDYNNFNCKNAYLTSKLLTIFIEHPIIFLGYSLSDENIEEILKSLANCLSEEKISILKDRLFFIEWNNGHPENDEISTFRKSFGSNKSIDMTRIYVNDFSVIYHALLNKKAKYNPRVLRELKHDIYKLILTNKPTKRMTVNINESSKIDSIDYVIGVGETGDIESINISNNNLSKVGYESIDAADIYRDIIYDSENYDGKMIIEKVP
ncbi:MAG: SIR2 family protein [Proteobacteria bacterium]|nr:SIR2 family protein [Pseudomonadota bacterium]